MRALESRLAPRPFTFLPPCAPALAAGAAALFAGCGDESPSTPVPFEDHPDGLWVDSRFAPRAAHLDPRERRALELMGAVGYADGIYEPPAETGVVRWDRDRAEAGLNLYCSGHGAEAVLMEMDGTVRHRWSLPWQALPGAPAPKERYEGAWRRVHLLEDGSLLAIYESLAIARVDLQSNLVWHVVAEVHHDLDVTADGHVLVLEREERDEPRLCLTAPIMDDLVAELGPGGERLARTSLVRALWNSPFSSLLFEAAARGGDVLHANTLVLLRPGDPVPHPAFQPGRVLVALREIDAIAVVDLENERVEWLQRGPWIAPHDPSLLPDGRLLVFDNMGHDGFSRLVAWDVEAERIEWQYAPDPPESFFSIFSGAVQALPGGNLLAVESYRGRAFELAPNGEVVWEFISPHRAGEEGELLAVLFDCRRVAPGPPFLTGLDGPR